MAFIITLKRKQLNCMIYERLRPTYLRAFAFVDIIIILAARGRVTIVERYHRCLGT